MSVLPRHTSAVDRREPVRLRSELKQDQQQQLRRQDELQKRRESLATREVLKAIRHPLSKNTVKSGRGQLKSIIPIDNTVNRRRRYYSEVWRWNLTVLRLRAAGVNANGRLPTPHVGQ